MLNEVFEICAELVINGCDIDLKLDTERESLFICSIKAEFAATCCPISNCKIGLLLQEIRQARCNYMQKMQREDVINEK